MILTKATYRFLTSIASKSFLFLGILSLTGCTSLNTLVIDVEKPAQIILPSNIDNIVIVDNTVIQPENIGQNEKINYILAEALFENIADKEYFKDVVFYEEPIREDNNFEKIVPLDSILVKKICLANKADAIISLDRFLVNTSLSEKALDFGTIGRFLDLKTDILFRVYSKEGATISPSLSISDSIYWSAIYIDNQALTDTLPDKMDALMEAARYSAEKLANALTPYWSNELRWYFGDVKEANSKVKENNWTEALTLWKSAYEKETKNSKKKARLANNIALAYELSDELEEAIKWINISCDLFEQTERTSVDKENRARAASYREHLLQRHSDFKLLDMRAKNTQ